MTGIEFMFFGFLWGMIFAGIVALLIAISVWEGPRTTDKKRPNIPPVTPWTR